MRVHEMASASTSLSFTSCMAGSFCYQHELHIPARLDGDAHEARTDEGFTVTAVLDLKHAVIAELGQRCGQDPLSKLCRRVAGSYPQG